MKFELSSSFKPTGDQPQAIDKLTKNWQAGLSDQVLLGVTGSGKTFTVANVIQNIQKPTLIISHNKTLAAQLYQEFKEFFPKNAVEYFVSYYDYYQPESYIPATDTYIEKDSDVNDEIDRLRLKATASLMTREDVIIVASVSCIYSLGSPSEYSKATLYLNRKPSPPTFVTREDILIRLTDLHYTRSDLDLKRACFRVAGENLDIWPAYESYILRLSFRGNAIESIKKLHPVSAQVLESLNEFILYPAKHYVAAPEKFNAALAQIKTDLQSQLAALDSRGKKLEAYRLKQRTEYDLEMLQEVGFVNGIENYSRYFDGRRAGEPPYSLLDFFGERFGHATKKDWLLVVDESHISIPQVRGMYNGDRSRKQTLVDFGFRLPSALDNRPLNFEEFLDRVPKTIYLSATPAQWELEKAAKAAKNAALSQPVVSGVVEQLVRPTGLVDPKITVLPTANQVFDLRLRIEAKIKTGQRVLVTTLTKKMAEGLSSYLEEQKLKVTYLHSDIQTLERSTILDDLRRGNYDVLVGINLLREGLDLPEVGLVAILDADKEGFLRSESSLIQVMGRAARHLQGEVVMYADAVTDSMRRAIAEVDRRRAIQEKYNQEHHITPVGITKALREKIVDPTIEELNRGEEKTVKKYKIVDLRDLPPNERGRALKDLEKKMKLAAEELDFELAAQIRDEIIDIKKNLS